VQLAPEVLVKSITWYVPPAYPCPRPSFSCSEPFGQDGGPVAAEDEGTGVAVRLLLAGPDALEALVEVDDVADDEQAATAATQSSAAAAQQETAANDRPVRIASPGPVAGFRVAERLRSGNTPVPPLCAAPPAPFRTL
jgi:hypothetical protein